MQRGCCNCAVQCRPLRCYSLQTATRSGCQSRVSQLRCVLSFYRSGFQKHSCPPSPLTGATSPGYTRSPAPTPSGCAAASAPARQQRPVTRLPARPQGRPVSLIRSRRQSLFMRPPSAGLKHSQVALSARQRPGGTRIQAKSWAGAHGETWRRMRHANSVCRRVCPAPGPRRRPRGTAAAAAPGCAAAAAAARRPPATAPHLGTAAPAPARRPWCGRTPCRCAAARAAPGTCSAARVTLQRRRRARRTAALRCLTRPGRLQRRTRVASAGAGGRAAHRELDVHPVDLVLAAAAKGQDLAAARKLAHDRGRVLRQEAEHRHEALVLRRSAPADSLLRPDSLTSRPHCPQGPSRAPARGPIRVVSGGAPAPLACDPAGPACPAPGAAAALPDPGPGRSARRTSASAPSACPDGCSAAARSVTAPASCSSRLCCGGGGTGASFPLPVGVRLRRRGVAPSL